MASNHELADQAVELTNMLFKAGKRQVQNEFGTNTLMTHPQLVTDYVSAASHIYAAMAGRQAALEVVESTIEKQKQLLEH